MSSCKTCPKWTKSKTDQAIERILSEYEIGLEPWALGFSGGKDSTAMIVLLIAAMEKLKNPVRNVTVIYCDTGVEIPTVRKFTKENLLLLSSYCKNKNLPITFKIASPKLNDRFFVKIIGRGYVPPTNKFRWCTDRLRINPVEAILKQIKSPQSMVLLGVREGESLERDKIIERNRKDTFILQQVGKNRKIFAPILDFSATDVWGVIVNANKIFQGNEMRLLELYKNAAGECPSIRDPKAAPCGKSRFGCWTCTVIRKDQAVTNLIEAGDSRLKPLLDFRNWLALIRDEESFRENRRRNGQPGKGPFTLKARKQILRKLFGAQKSSKYKLIQNSELRAIKELWKLDL